LNRACPIPIERIKLINQKGEKDQQRNTSLAINVSLCQPCLEANIETAAICERYAILSNASYSPSEGSVLETDKKALNAKMALIFIQCASCGDKQVKKNTNKTNKNCKI
jgi:hypothetical protein